MFAGELKNSFLFFLFLLDLRIHQTIESGHHHVQWTTCMDRQGSDQATRFHATMIPEKVCTMSTMSFVGLNLASNRLV